ncbi:inositol monophosphatase family protein [Fervidibacillus halotolerans]|uniref:inositol-phosphate phosphatase n=1 Tax=Fervidibacillus halotolerans TaxID=2980027 RepID=A0A9E8RXY5_9BACI|nr:inositol monophosphatase family protein [Fervidibacillus halotolerans]WAA13245.1 inositol monophosphatase family protein [Fervidibacillus halotolerans]
MINWTEIDQFTKEWIKEAGKRIRQSLSEQLHISTKANPNDLVTNIDKDTERFFIERIRKTFPNHKILGEEGFGDELKSTEGVIWVIDPIDGTMNLVHMQRNFTISIGIFENGKGKLAYIYDVMNDELYHAMNGSGAFFNGKRLPKLLDKPLSECIIGLNSIWLTENRRIDHRMLTPLVKGARGTRSIGSAALEMGYIATGWMDVYISLRLSPWDFAAGMIIIEELGGKATKLTGEPLSILEKSSVFFAGPAVHEQILKQYLSEYVEK